VSFNLAEVAPVEPWLGPLVILSGLVVTLGFIMLIDGIMRGLFDAIRSFVSNLPFAGTALDNAVHHGEQAISNALGHAISGIETRIAMEWHSFAHGMAYLWASLGQAAHDIYYVARLVGGAVAHSDLNALNKRLSREINAAAHSADVAIAHALHAAKVFAHSVAQGVYPRLRSLEHEVTKTIPKEIKTVRQLAKEAEAEATRAWDLVKSQPWALSTAAWALVVATALSTLGLDWIKCRSANSFFKKAGCGFWKLLEDALGILATLALGVFGVLKPEELANAAVTAVDAIEPILADILKN
jgi:hypothetical protein